MCAECVGVLTAEVKLFIWIISTVIVSVAFPMRLDAHVVLALKQEGGAVCAVGKTSRWKSEPLCQTQVSNQTHNSQSWWGQDQRPIKKYTCMLYSLNVKTLLFVMETITITKECTWKTIHCGTLTTGRLICIVQTVGVAITFEAFSDTVSTAALEVTGVTSPQLCNAKRSITSHKSILHSWEKGGTNFVFVMTTVKTPLASWIKEHPKSHKFFLHSYMGNTFLFHVSHLE